MPDITFTSAGQSEVSHPLEVYIYYLGDPPMADDASKELAWFICFNPVRFFTMTWMPILLRF